MGELRWIKFGHTLLAQLTKPDSRKTVYRRTYTINLWKIICKTVVEFAGLTSGRTADITRRYACWGCNVHFARENLSQMFHRKAENMRFAGTLVTRGVQMQISEIVYFYVDAAVQQK